MRATGAGLAAILLAGQAAMADGLTGKTYIIELSSSQYDSGYG